MKRKRFGTAKGTMTGDELRIERDRLLDEHRELEQVHERLRGNPYDHEEHQLHADRLRRHIERLHAFIDALRKFTGG
jgi:hypothetical protein